MSLITVIKGGSGANFANQDLTFTADRNHNADGFDLTITNVGIFSIDGVTKTKGELFLGDGVTSVIKLDCVSFGKTLEIKSATGSFNTLMFVVGAAGAVSYLSTTAPAWVMDQRLRFDTAGESWLYANNGGFGLSLSGRNVLARCIHIDENDRVIMKAKNSIIADADLNASDLSFSMDETLNNLLVKCKYSTGVVKSATIPLV